MGIDKSCVTQYNLFVMINTLQQKENNMKNRIVLLLVVTLLLLLSACNEGASDNQLNHRDSPVENPEKRRLNRQKFINILTGKTARCSV